jgi:hypothetical protein
MATVNTRIKQDAKDDAKTALLFASGLLVLTALCLTGVFGVLTVRTMDPWGRAVLALMEFAGFVMALAIAVHFMIDCITHLIDYAQLPFPETNVIDKEPVASLEKIPADTSTI